MATEKELRSIQTTQLFELLKIKKDNPSLNIIGLDVFIAKTISAMNQEDVAWVEKTIEELYK